MSDEDTTALKRFYEVQQQGLNRWSYFLPAPRSRTFKVWRSFFDPLYQGMMGVAVEGCRTCIKLIVVPAAVIRDLSQGT